MPIANYGVLRGKASQRILATRNSEHFQILINADNDPHRIAINTQSSEAPSEVLFYADDDFKHPITDAITEAALADGYTPVVSKAGGIAIDFIRGNLFDVTKMVPLASSVAGDNNDLNDKLDFFVQQAIGDADAVVYAFGQHWIDADGADRYFPSIKPSTGIHDIHMNQGNPQGSYFKDNGIYQDGGLIFHYPSRNRWAAVFTAFQSQAFHTDDTTGNPVTTVPTDPTNPTDPTEPSVSTPVSIIAALINPAGNEVGAEYIILLNKSLKPIDLTGWQIADKLKNKDTLGHVTIPAGNTIKITLTGKGAQLSNKGGIITLLNKEGLKIDGATYTKDDAAKEGVLIEL